MGYVCLKCYGKSTTRCPECGACAHSDCLHLKHLRRLDKAERRDHQIKQNLARMISRENWHGLEESHRL